MAPVDAVRSLAFLVGAALAVPQVACQSSLTGPDALERDLAIVRAATARYQDVSVALQDGFIADPICVSAGPRGAMGIHYLNPGRMDDLLVAEEPEILLYVRENGVPRLVGIEYWKPVLQGGAPYFGSAPPSQPGPNPVMFGRAFEGPMPGHSPTMPWHFDLHVWLFRDNPDGVFSQFNRAVSCS